MKTFPAVLLVLYLCVVPLMAQEEVFRFERAFERIDKLVERTMQENKTPGMALALTSRVGLLHLSTYGFANMMRITRNARNSVWRRLDWEVVHSSCHFTTA